MRTAIFIREKYHYRTAFYSKFGSAAFYEKMAFVDFIFGITGLTTDLTDLISGSLGGAKPDENPMWVGVTSITAFIFGGVSLWLAQEALVIFGGEKPTSRGNKMNIVVRDEKLKIGLAYGIVNLILWGFLFFFIAPNIKE